MDAEMLKFLIQTGSFAVLVFIVLWLFVKHIPRLEERGEKRDTAFLAALDKQHVEHQSEQNRIGDRFDGAVTRIESKIDGIRVSRANGGG
jgi:ABC-type nickel/cobalt efflux system permease component RcnA